MITSLTSGLPSREICLNRPCPLALHRDRLPLGGRPDADHRIGGLVVRDGLAVTGDVGLRNLEHDRLDRVAGEIVDPAALVAQAGAGQVDRVEDPAERREERVLALAGEHLAAAGQALDRACLRLLVVRNGLRPHVAGGRRNLPSDDLGVTLGDPGHRVGLHHVPVRAVDRVDRLPVRVQERVRVPGLRLEVEQVPDVGDTVTGVVDVQVVVGVVVELVEVRPAGRILDRHPVPNDRQGARGILRSEGVGVRVVSRRIDRGQGRLSMRGAKAQRHRDRQRGERGEQCELPHFVLLAAVDLSVGVHDREQPPIRPLVGDASTPDRLGRIRKSLQIGD